MTNFEDYTLENVKGNPELWKDTDPVRPELSVKFKTSEGRHVYGLKSPTGEYTAFVCFSQSTDVPADITGLSSMTSTVGRIAVPYTVWSNKRGAGRAIINKLIEMVRQTNLVDRVVTLSPRTEMARKFHLRNSASIYRENIVTVNFEYDLKVTA